MAAPAVDRVAVVLLAPAVGRVAGQAALLAPAVGRVAGQAALLAPAVGRVAVVMLALAVGQAG